MKKYFLFVGVFAFLFSCNQTASTQNEKVEDVAPVVKEIPPTTVEFEKEEFDFGSIQQGEIVSYTFEFTNTGTNNLVVYSIDSDCGCTIPKYNNNPVKPGEKGQVEVQFDSGGYRGNQVKQVSLKMNTEEGDYHLFIYSFVETDA